MVSIGIDIGSLYIKGVAIDEGGVCLWQRKDRHHGHVGEWFGRYREQVNGHRLGVAALATELGHPTFDPTMCLAAGVRVLCPEARNVLEVGGSSLTLVRLDAGGQILSVHRNSLCAAGTGAFLDEQATRLNIDVESMCGAPATQPPSIATRCAVFAKSDLIHRQQEGYSRDLLWSGLCRGLADGVLRTLTYGQPLEGCTAVCGGVALNQSFVWWLKQALAAQGRHGESARLEVVSSPEFAVAVGAALLARHGERESRVFLSAAPAVARAADTAARPPLSLLKSKYPQHAPLARLVDLAGNEVTVHHAPAEGIGCAEVSLGVDIGSTSTKCVLVDAEGRILLDVYRRTEGDPIGATRKLLDAVREADRTHGFGFVVRAAATTGSGRKLVGTVIGADLVVNEISAHGAGAMRNDPGVRTIFEIGGQDAKYLAIQDGRVVDANMNYVCAAGTGSFVEALAARLGYSLEESGTAALGTAAPFTSSRCTVFMEQDVLDLVQRGASRAEALGAVLYSVVENYLERVVGHRRVSRDRITFQGATARNLGLVAAIENLLGVEVVVSPYCHVMGAYGAALLAREEVGDGASRFRGLDLGQRAITLDEESCHLCANDCRLSRVTIEGVEERPAWGMLCGREEGEAKRRVNPHYTAFRKRMRLATSGARSIRPSAAATTTTRLDRHRAVMPRTLTTLSFFQFWSACLDHLGIDVTAGPVTDQACLDRGKQCAGGEMCLPMKAAHGHIARAIEAGGDGLVFVPHMIADERVPGLSHTKFCPYVEAVPSLVRSALSAQGLDVSRLVSPVLDLTAPDRVNAENLVAALAPFTHVSVKAATTALAKGRAARAVHQAQVRELGETALERLHASGEAGIVVVGRPYNTFDSAVSLDLPEFIANCGVDTIPMDALPFDPSQLTGEFQNMFWHYGQRILSALMQVARDPSLYAVYLTNFSCGPDSFLLSYAETIMGDKPMLVLELDEHGSSGGYQTRIEAFLDVVRNARRRGAKAVSERPVPREPGGGADWKNRTLWVPPMHPVGARFLAAAVRSNGTDARALPPEDDEAYALGKKMLRGNECLPAPLTLGGFLKQMETERAEGRQPAKPAALFMPTACGPCRFGQYRTLQRLALDRMGLGDVPILSPGSDDTYHTLQPVSLIWESLVAADILFKMRCRVKPYEMTEGDAASELEASMQSIEAQLEKGKVNWDRELGAAMERFRRIPVRTVRKPLVGIVGEIYVRSNPYANGYVVESVERLGGEAWLAPLSEWFEYTVWMEHYFAKRAKVGAVERAKALVKRNYMIGRAHRLYKPVLPFLGDRLEPEIGTLIETGRRVLPLEFEGESILTVARAMQFEHDGCQLVVNCAPFSCMHGNITTALFEQMRNRLGIPVVNLFYDGASGNDELSTFVQQAARRCQS